MTVDAETLLRAGVAVFVVAAAVVVYRLSGRRQPPREGMRWFDHLDDLRRRLFVSVAAVLVVSALVFSFRWPADSAHPVPALQDNLAAQAFRRMAADLVPPGVQLVQVRPLDGFMAELAIAFGIAVVVTLPVTLGQLGGFITPALEERERRLLRRAAVPVLALFVAGVAFGYLFVLPFLFSTLYGYGTALGAQPLLQVSELVSFSLSLLLVFGAAFQTPVAMYALTRVGLVPAEAWTRVWRHATVVIVVVAALVTDPTIVSQVMVAVPLLLLYGVGILAARTAQKRAEAA